MTNVHHLHNSTPALRAIDGLKIVLAGGDSICEGWLVYGTELNEIKAQHPGHDGKRAFGEAKKAANLNVWPRDGISSEKEDIAIHPAAQSSAMWAAALKPEELAVYRAQYPDIEVTVKNGFRWLHAKVTEAAKPVAKPAAKVSSKMEKAIDAVAPKMERGEPVKARELGKEIGVSHVTVETAVAVVKDRQMRQPVETIIDPETLPLSDRAKLEKAKMQLVKQLTKEFDAEIEKLKEEKRREVKAHIEHLNNVYREDNERHRKIIEAYKGVMTKAEHRLVLSCLHPDSRGSVSPERLAEAFRILSDREIALLPGV